MAFECGDLVTLGIQESKVHFTAVNWSLLISFDCVLNLLDSSRVKLDYLFVCKIELAILPSDIFLEHVSIAFFFNFRGVHGIHGLLHHGFFHHHLLHGSLFAEPKADFTEWTALELRGSNAPLSPLNLHVGKLSQVLRLH